MVIKMEYKYVLALLLAAAVGILAVSIAGAHSNGNQNTMMDDGNSGMMGMMGGMGMMNGMMSTDGFVHNEDDIDWMREEMKEHMNFTDEEFNEMAEHCPMMRGR